MRSCGLTTPFYVEGHLVGKVEYKSGAWHAYTPGGSSVSGPTLEGALILLAPVLRAEIVVLKQILLPDGCTKEACDAALREAKLPFHVIFDAGTIRIELVGDDAVEKLFAPTEKDEE